MTTKKAPPIQLIPGTRDVIFLEEYTIETFLGNIIIPKDFICDGASIPRIIWPIVSPYDPGVREPAFAHDVLYRLAEARFANGKKVTRKIADKIFYEELLESPEVPNWKAWLMWKAVRIGGADSWRES